MLFQLKAKTTYIMSGRKYHPLLSHQQAPVATYVWLAHVMYYT